MATPVDETNRAAPVVDNSDVDARRRSTMAMADDVLEGIDLTPTWGDIIGAIPLIGPWLARVLGFESNEDIDDASSVASDMSYQETVEQTLLQKFNSMNDTEAQTLINELETDDKNLLALNVYEVHKEQNPDYEHHWGFGEWILGDVAANRDLIRQAIEKAFG